MRSEPKRKKSVKSLREIEYDDDSCKVNFCKDDNPNLDIKEFKWTEEQREYIETCMNRKTNFVFNSSTAGTGKSLCTMYAALKLLNDPKSGIKEIIFVRNPVPSSSYSVGYLKGSLDDKFSVYMEVANQTMRELLNETDFLKAKKYFKFIPLEFVKSLSFHSSFIIVEEYEDISMIKELRLIMSRIGKGSKMIFVGDIEQSDVRNGCGKVVFDIFDNEDARNHGIHCIKFNSKVTLRNPIISYVLEKLKC